MIKALILTAIACFLNIGAPIVNSSVALNVYEQQSEYIEIEKPKKAYYNDEQYYIGLTANELNNYTFDNLNDLLVQYDNDDEIFESLFTELSYGDFVIENTPTVSFGVVDDYYYFLASFQLNNNYLDISFNYNSVDDYKTKDNKFLCYQSDFIDFEDTLYLTCGRTSYADIKQAIEADILANTQSENNMPSITDIFSEIASAVTNFISTLVSAFNGVTTLFWDASANTGAGGFTFLGVLVLIGCGVGLVYLAYRVIKGLMHRV